MNRTKALKILNLSIDSSMDEITKQFRKISISKHPDQGGCEEEYKKITCAYSFLKDNDDSIFNVGEMGIEDVFFKKVRVVTIIFDGTDYQFDLVDL